MCSYKRALDAARTLSGNLVLEPFFLCFDRKDTSNTGVDDFSYVTQRS